MDEQLPAAAAQMVRDNYERVVDRVATACARAGRPAGAVTIVCVTKTVGLGAVIAASEAGARVFGENRVQEAEDKLRAWRELTPRRSGEWHLIGHLQTNKAKVAAQLVDAVHSIDSVRLARELSRRAVDAGRQLRVLLEVNIADEASKSGLAPAELEATAPVVAALPGLTLVGLMTIAPLAAPGELARPYFARLRDLRDAVVGAHPLVSLPELSMGMTNDFESAIAEGATLVRIGRAIFGDRPA